MTRVVAAALLLLLFLAPRSSFAQVRGGAALGESMAGLGNTVRVLMIGAHPDDEDTALLTWLSRAQHVETAYLSLTRGDGGQNLIGNELGEALGVVRTEELLAARRIDGAHQYFTRAFDFGFSKSAAEAYTHWPHDELLHDVVAVVRAFRPHVVVAVFSGTPRDGHGQHQVSGLLAREAYDLAADTVRIPRAATQGVGGWTVSKLYRRDYFDQQAATLSLNVGEYSPLLGRSYAEIAAESRSQHKSQGFGMLQRKGPRMDFVRREASRVASPRNATDERSIFDGIDTTLSRIRSAVTAAGARAALDSLDAAVRDVGRAADLSHPVRMLAPLSHVISLVRRARGPCPLPVDAPCPSLTPDADRTLQPVAGRALTTMRLASAIALEAESGREIVAIAAPRRGARAAAAETLAVSATLYNRSGGPVAHGTFAYRGHDVDGAEGAPAHTVPLPADSVARSLSTVTGLAVTQPWWLVRPRRGDMFSMPVSLVAEDARPGPGVVTVDAVIADTPVGFSTPIVYRIADPVKGDLRRTIAVAPTLSVTLDESVEYAPANTPIDRVVRVTVRSAATSPRTARVSLTLPVGLAADTTVRTVVLPSHGAVRTAAFRVRGRVAAGRDSIRAVAESEGVAYTDGYVAVEYDHIRPQKLYRPATIQLVGVDIALPVHRSIGYIAGVGDNVAPTLRAIGFDVTVLDPAALPATDLGQFAAVVVGPRAYEASTDLVANNARLLDYARAGGTLVVQYGQYEMTRPGMMPYPITLARPHDRVTDERAPVTVVQPGARVLTTPNRIGPRDWEGWVQERALYMPRSHDAAYAAPLSMNDPGEPANDGALLLAPLGKGTYVYTSLALFRQLPAGVPGAARLLANIIAAGAARGGKEVVP
ncbi:MAG: hypothetical protein NVS1B4_21950 [Gemmatimonadaceae bacterium]